MPEEKERVMDVLTVGMMVWDIPIAPVPKGIFEMEKAEITAPEPTTGGDALNVAVTLAKLGGKPAVAGRLGLDANGDAVLRKTEEAGVDISQVIRDEEGRTAVSYLLIDEEGEKHALSDTQIYHRLTAEDVSDEAIARSRLVYFGSAFQMGQMDRGGNLKLFKRAHDFGKWTAMDTALADDTADREVLLEQLAPALGETDVFLPSYKEAVHLSGEETPEKIAEFFQPFGIRIFGVKLGGEGCYLTDYQEAYRLPCFSDFPVKDTTGAGDSFVGGFLRGFLAGWDLESCGRFASAVAAHNVSAKGAAAGVPDFDTVLRFLTKNGFEMKKGFERKKREGSR